MAHFAQLDENNEVINVIVLNNDVLLDENNNEIETLGIDFLKSLFGSETNWVQTSYNGNFRKIYAGLNMIFDKDNDRFMPKQPFASWSFDEESYQWQPPIPMPETDGIRYEWNETTQNWNEVVIVFSSDPNVLPTGADIPELMPINENSIVES